MFVTYLNKVSSFFFPILLLLFFLLRLFFQTLQGLRCHYKTSQTYHLSLNNTHVPANLCPKGACQLDQINPTCQNNHCMLKTLPFLFFPSPPVSNVFYKLYKNWDFTLLFVSYHPHPGTHSYFCFHLILKFLFQHLQ